ncbi:MAG: hypothetical protein ACRC46_11770 [Thermoguttaceae bacterium]
MKMFERVVRAVACTVTVAVLVLPVTASAAEWYRGNFHMHSFWSDGDVFPEQAVAWYRDHGYHFVSLTDHSALQTRSDVFREVGKGAVTAEKLAAYRALCGENWVETKTEGEGDAAKTFVRLRPCREFAEKMNEPGKFLVIPGHEQNATIAGVQLHGNLINVAGTVPFQHAETVSESIRRNVAAMKQHAGMHGLNSLYISNHNCWVYFDIVPQDLIDVPEVRFFEFLNCQPTYKPTAGVPFWSPEKFWDIVNAFRLDAGQLPLYAIAQDDTHNYAQKGPKTRDLGNDWFVVRADALTPEQIIQAMYRGDFYCSTGVTLADVQFDRAKKTLSVKVAPEEGVTYTIRFNGTKKGFDKTTTTVTDPAEGKKPARTIAIYSDAIGEEFSSTEGVEASYTMTGDELYVRATVVSSRESNYDDPTGYRPTHASAWTQPYTLTTIVE